MNYRGHRINEDDEWTPVRIQKQLIDESIKKRERLENALNRLKAKPELWEQSLRYLIYTHNPLVAEWVKIINSMTAEEFLTKYENRSLFDLLEVDHGQFLEIMPFSLTEKRLAKNIVLS